MPRRRCDAYSFIPSWAAEALAALIYRYRWRRLRRNLYQCARCGWKVSSRARADGCSCERYPPQNLRGDLRGRRAETESGNVH